MASLWLAWCHYDLDPDKCQKIDGWLWKHFWANIHHCPVKGRVFLHLGARAAETLSAWVFYMLNLNKIPCLEDLMILSRFTSCRRYYKQWFQNQDQNCSTVFLVFSIVFWTSNWVTAHSKKWLCIARAELREDRLATERLFIWKLQSIGTKMKWLWDCTENQQCKREGDVIREQHLSSIGVWAPGPTCLYAERPGFTYIVFRMDKRHRW